MTDDIVKRLRLAAQYRPNPEMFRYAADEIERLRAGIRHLIDFSYGCHCYGQSDEPCPHDWDVPQMDAETVDAITGDLVCALYDSKSQRALVAEQILARNDIPAEARRLAREILDSPGKPDEIAVRTQAIHQLLNLFDPVNYAPGWD